MRGRYAAGPARVVLLDPSDRVLLSRPLTRTGPRRGSGGSCPAAASNGARRAGRRPSGSCTRRPASRTSRWAPACGATTPSSTSAPTTSTSTSDVHVARGDGGEYRPAGLEALEAQAFSGARWWPLDELARPGGGRGQDHPAVAGRAAVGAAGVAGFRGPLAGGAHRHGGARQHRLIGIGEPIPGNSGSRGAAPPQVGKIYGETARQGK